MDGKNKFVDKRNQAALSPLPPSLPSLLSLNK